MNILLVTDAYPPEIRSISYMMQELAEELILRGHKVTVVTCQPQYNLSVGDRAKKFDTFSVENNVGVIRVKTPPHHKVNFIRRGISQLMLSHLFLKKIKMFVKEKVDAVIVYSPPLPLSMLGAKVKKVYGAKYLLNIQDIFPQNAVDLGIMKNKLLIKYFERMEKKAYRSADKVTSHTEGGKKFLVEKKGLAEEKVEVIYNWIDLDAFKNVKSTGIFREKYGLKDKFVFLFPGILGPSQNLELIIHAARRVIDLPDICFLFVGDGTEKEKLQKMVEEYNLQNVRFEPFVSQEEYPSLAKEMDVGIACLSSKNKTPVIPGKILGFMAGSIPIAAFLNKESDVHGMIKEAQCGYSVVSDNEEKAAGLVRKIFNEKDMLAYYGQNGYNYAAKYFSKKVCIDKIEQLCKV